MTARPSNQPSNEGVLGLDRRSEAVDERIVVHLPTTAPPLPLLDGSTGLLAASQWQLAVKRSLDIVVAAIALVVLSPVFLFLAIGVKLSSPGPVFYWSHRVGRDETPLRIPKFRSMYVDAEERLAALIWFNEVSGPVFKIRDDPRMTEFGRFMRRFSFDEVPQFYNVLKGDMTLVGPRPPLPAEVETYTPLQRQRLYVKPGLTCIWQVSGRSDLDFETWMAMDLDYIRGWTPMSDLQLLAKTLPAVATGKGAY